MADIETTYCFDDNAATGEFIINVGGVLMTTYNFSSSPTPEVSITALTSVVSISTEDLISLNFDITTFSNQIRVRFGPPDLTTSKFKAELEKNTSSIEARMEVESVLVTDVKWESGTSLATFQPRGANILTWSDYLGWQTFLKRVLSEIRRF